MGPPGAQRPVWPGAGEGGKQRSSPDVEAEEGEKQVVGVGPQLRITLFSFCSVCFDPPPPSGALRSATSETELRLFFLGLAMRRLSALSPLEPGVEGRLACLRRLRRPGRRAPAPFPRAIFSGNPSRLSYREMPSARGPPTWWGTLSPLLPHHSGVSNPPRRREVRETFAIFTLRVTPRMWRPPQLSVAQLFCPCALERLLWQCPARASNTALGGAQGHTPPTRSVDLRLGSESGFRTAIWLSDYMGHESCRPGS